jgi:NAD(P)-dependent dehydrogenase (short-subunit alcohol dehydrogenase family)
VEPPGSGVDHAQEGGHSVRISDTAAVVTGAASGLGAATARSLAKAGVSVFALDLPDAVEAAAPVRGVQLIAADVTSEGEVVAALARVAECGLPLRTVVNCAGIAPSERILGRRGVHDLALYAKVVGVNLVGTFMVLALAAEQIARTEPDEQGQRGVVINTASVAAFEGQIGQAAYASAKAGVVGLTLPAARDLAAVGIRVCCIAPGSLLTPIMATLTEATRASLAASVTFPKRLGRADEFAQLVLSIVDNDYLNGEVVRLDGALRLGQR